MSVRIVMGAWRAPRPRDIGPDLIEIDLNRQHIQRGDIAVRMPFKRFRVTSCVLAVAPHLAAYDALEQALFGDDEDGGPLKLRQLQHVYLYQACKDLACLGISFETRWGRGVEAVIADVIPPPETLNSARPSGSRRTLGPREAVPAALASPARRRALSVIASERVGYRP